MAAKDLIRIRNGKGEHRARQAAFERRRYPTDLTDQEWHVVQPLLPPSSARGRRPGIDLREVLNAIRYLAWAGCGWRMLPVHFGPWQTIYWWFRRLVRRFLFVTLHNIALMLDRERVGRGPGQPDPEVASCARRWGL